MNDGIDFLLGLLVSLLSASARFSADECFFFAWSKKGSSQSVRPYIQQVNMQVNIHKHVHLVEMTLTAMHNWTCMFPEVEQENKSDITM